MTVVLVSEPINKPLNKMCKPDPVSETCPQYIFRAEIWKISDSFYLKFSVFGDEIFCIFEFSLYVFSSCFKMCDSAGCSGP